MAYTETDLDKQLKKLPLPVAASGTVVWAKMLSFPWCPATVVDRLTKAQLAEWEEACGKNDSSLLEKGKAFAVQFFEDNTLGICKHVLLWEDGKKAGLSVNVAGGKEAERAHGNGKKKRTTRASEGGCKKAKTSAAVPDDDDGERNERERDEDEDKDEEDDDDGNDDEEDVDDDDNDDNDDEDSDDSLARTFTENLAERNISQTKAAEQMRIRPADLSNWRNGKHQSVSMAAKVSEAIAMWLHDDEERNEREASREDDDEEEDDDDDNEDDDEEDSDLDSLFKDLKEPSSSLARAFTKKLAELNISQTKAAEQMHIRPADLSNWRNGKHQSASMTAKVSEAIAMWMQEADDSD
eukprot:2951783-Prymnesium_polylepis.1